MANPLSLHADRLEGIKFTRRRLYEEERKIRIFDGHRRVIGVDLDVLGKQVQEKIKNKTLRETYKKKYDADLMLQQDVMYSKDIEMEQRKNIIRGDLEKYRCDLQSYTDRREFDLNDPMIIKNALPARWGDEDPRLGVSSAQIFEGEDLGFERRRKMQRFQQNAWLTQQCTERKCSIEARIKAHDVLVDSILSREKVLEYKQRADDDKQQEIIDDTLEYNHKLAELRRIQREREEKENYEDNMAEMYNMLSSDMLTENPDVAQSPTNPNKKIAIMYRGMSNEELQLFRYEQRRNYEKIKQRYADRLLLEQQIGQYALNMDYELMLKSLAIERKDQQLVDEQAAYNKVLAVEQKQIRHAENTRRNAYLPGFFDQFNTTSR